MGVGERTEPGGPRDSNHGKPTTDDPDFGAKGNVRILEPEEKEQRISSNDINSVSKKRKERKKILLMKCWSLKRKTSWSVPWPVRTTNTPENPSKYSEVKPGKEDLGWSGPDPLHPRLLRPFRQTNTQRRRRRTLESDKDPVP